MVSLRLRNIFRFTSQVKIWSLCTSPSSPFSSSNLENAALSTALRFSEVSGEDIYTSVSGLKTDHLIKKYQSKAKVIF